MAATQAAGGSTLTAETRPPALVQRARFKLSDILDSDSEDGIDGTQFQQNTLGDIMMNGNQFFDADRNEIFFSAGTEETRDSERRELLEGIRNLDYYDHTVFGKMDREDLTVSDAVAAM
ncbi:hypothetical protein B0H10DRAFT_2446303, partial [Mycena sp. CBHHK59/15]